jgi:hypothetical protein
MRTEVFVHVQSSQWVRVVTAYGSCQHFFQQRECLQWTGLCHCFHLTGARSDRPIAETNITITTRKRILIEPSPPPGEKTKNLSIKVRDLMPASSSKQSNAPHPAMVKIKPNTTPRVVLSIWVSPLYLAEIKFAECGVVGTNDLWSAAKSNALAQRTTAAAMNACRADML